jgi:hypothetical protein
MHIFSNAMDIIISTDMMSKVQNHKKQNEKKMVVTKALLVGAAMMLGLAATVGWLSQEAQAARCLDCDTNQDPGTGPVPACPNGIFSCPPWQGGHGELTCDPECPRDDGIITRPMPPLLP